MKVLTRPGCTEFTRMPSAPMVHRSVEREAPDRPLARVVGGPSPRPDRSHDETEVDDAAPSGDA
jgi:hypothetical protein